MQDPRIYPDTHIEISGFRRAGGILIKGRNHLFQWDKIDSMHPVTGAGRFQEAGSATVQRIHLVSAEDLPDIC